MNDTRRYESKHNNIGCNAKNCVYNPDGTSCSAAHIEVAGKTAECTGETCCDTFRQKRL